MIDFDFVIKENARAADRCLQKGSSESAGYYNGKAAAYKELRPTVNFLLERVSNLESCLSDLLETIVDELGLSFTMENIEVINKACSMLPENHEFKSKETDSE